MKKSKQLILDCANNYSRGSQVRNLGGMVKILAGELRLKGEKVQAFCLDQSEFTYKNAGRVLREDQFDLVGLDADGNRVGDVIASNKNPMLLWKQAIKMTPNSSTIFGFNIFKILSVAMLHPHGESKGESKGRI